MASVWTASERDGSQKEDSTRTGSRPPDPKRAKFRTWLFRIARNLIVHALAARRRDPYGTGDSDFRALSQEQSGRDSADSRLFDQEYRRQLLAWAADRVRGQFHETTWQASG